MQKRFDNVSIINWIITIVILLLLVSVPLIYLLTGYQTADRHSQQQLELKSEMSSQLIGRTGDLWVYWGSRIQRLINQQPAFDEYDWVRIYDLTGRLIVQTDASSPPYITKRTELYDIGELVGYFEFNHSIRTLIFNTILIFTVGLIICAVSLLLTRKYIIIPLQKSSSLQKRTEAKISKAKRDYEMILEAAGEGIYGLDLDGKTTFINPAAARMLGYEPEELIGQTQHDVIHHTRSDGTPYPRKECPICESFIDGNVRRVSDEIFWRKDGSSFQVDYVSTPIKEHSDVLGAVVVFEDVSERYKAEIERNKTEEALRTNERRYRSLIEVTQVIPWEIDVSTWRPTYIGPQAADTFGYDIDSFYDEEFWLKYLFPEDRELVLNFYQAQKVVDKSDELEYRIRSSNGETVWIRDMVHLVGDKDKGLLLQGIMVNITESVEKEAQLLHAQKMEAVGRLTGGIAHDFNNLLTIIQGNLKLLSRSVSKGIDIDKEIIDDALSATADGAELTERLLTFSHRQSLKPEYVHINDLIESSTRLFRRMIGEDINFSTSLIGQNPVVFVDPAQFENALINLVINARDAMSSGGKLNISTNIKSIPHRTYDGILELNRGDYVSVEVADNGSGMNSNILKQSCEPFFTTKGSDGGSGLGLSMVYGFVTQSGGGIGISSRVGKGTQVKLFLPLVPASDNTVKRAIDHNPQEDIPTGTETILVVEDEDRVRSFAVKSLKDLGYKVLNVPDAEKAMKTMQSNPKIDLLFSDNVLPGGMTGRELADWTKQHYPDIKVILTTGFTSRKKAGNSVYDGIFSLLKKPYSQDELAKYIRSVLDGEKPSGHDM